MRLRVHPADGALVAILTVAVAVAAVRVPAAGPAVFPLLFVHAALLALTSAMAAAAARTEGWRGWAVLRPVFVAGLVFLLYSTIGRLGVTAMPLADRALSLVDTRLAGFDPALALQRLDTPARVEVFSLVYACFIPYVYLSIILGSLGRPPLERDQFLTGWVFTYAVAYVGYLLLPARGPIAFHAGLPPLPGGFFYRVVQAGTEATGGLQGVFPSLHVGASVYLCGFDLGTNRLRGLTYLPMVILICVSTLALRYHYAVDLVVGTAVALACIHLGRRAIARWSRARAAAGLPALPAGE